MVQVLDGYFFGLSALIVIPYQLFFFFIAYAFKFDKVTDLAGGSNFLILAIVLCSCGIGGVQQIILSTFQGIWASRLSMFLLFRVLTLGKDDRFDDTRHKFFPFLGFWIFQMVWVWLVSVPLMLVNSPITYPQIEGINAANIVGIVIFLIGFLLEVTADSSKWEFKQKQNKMKETNQATGTSKELTSAFIQSSVWKWSRHPNYFGEILLWWGIWLISLKSTNQPSIIWMGLVSPLFTMLLLLFVSGMPIAEKKSNSKYGDEYQDYKKRTSIFWPLPPKVWQWTPNFIKKSIGVEWGIYELKDEKNDKKNDENGDSR